MTLTLHENGGFSSLVSCDINQYNDTKAVSIIAMSISILVPVPPNKRRAVTISFPYLEMQRPDIPKRLPIGRIFAE